MLFNSLAFVVFILLVIPLYYSLRLKYQNIFLLIVSYIFYGYWDWRFLFLLAISTAVDYSIGIAISKTDKLSRRRFFLFISLTTNLGILGFFKYFDFFVQSAADFLIFLGFQPHIPTLNIILPVGISFYTFQTLSYTIDIYRRQLTPTRDLIAFALFVSYFPQLVAGPIERARHLLPRLTQERIVSWHAVAVGLELIIIGYFKKVGIADSLGPIIDGRFAAPNAASGADLLLVIYLFSIQIYCDFSGYTDIARGVSRLLGIELMRNFNQPYFSKNITDFWRRWHISLSSWLRDYLYISMGGNRYGRLKTYRNLLMTMVLGGLWHGANWTFVIWGLLHGLYLSIHKWIIERTTNQTDHQHWLKNLIAIVITFHLVSLTWIFFRADSFHIAMQIIYGIISWQPNESWLTPLNWLSPKLFILLTTLFMLERIQIKQGDHAIMVGRSAFMRTMVYSWLIVLTLTLGNLNDNVPFIYFQF
jgi:D-alanyl-lipoteichoic acid acyltransferase DltB (MBOAT superfamily)